MNASEKTKPVHSAEVIQMGFAGLRGAGLEAKFREYHTANSEVYCKLRELALQMHRRGVGQYGIGGLFEVLHWHRRMETVEPEGDFKLNNNYRSFYARLLMEQEPELKNFFELRTLRWQTYEVN